MKYTAAAADHLLFLQFLSSSEEGGGAEGIPPSASLLTHEGYNNAYLFIPLGMGSRKPVGYVTLADTVVLKHASSIFR